MGDDLSKYNLPIDDLIADCDEYASEELNFSKRLAQMQQQLNGLADAFRGLEQQLQLLVEVVGRLQTAYQQYPTTAGTTTINPYAVVTLPNTSGGNWSWMPNKTQSPLDRPQDNTTC